MVKSSSPAAEEMISLSNLLKPGRYIALNDKRLIKPAGIKEAVPQPADEEPPETTMGQDEGARRLEEAEQLRRQMIEKAKRQAEQILQQAQAESEKKLAEAESEIERWWEERRREDEQRIETIIAEARERGFEQGRAEAEQFVLAEYEQRLDEAAAILEKAHAEKEKIIAEAEPFLLELSTEIAAKVIGKQLELEPQWTIEAIRKVLGRRKEHGMITLCVAPEHFAYISDAREELMLVLDSQADLQIIPDKRVRDAGCIVRSSYGSIDARIDTQLAELKKALLEASAADAEGRDVDLHASS